MMAEVAVDLDPRMTFDTFVVGPGNRLASAAARRAADSPAASYNPLFLYSASGLGKSHILNAMAHHSERLNPEACVLYQTLEGYLNELTDALAQGREEAMRERYKDLDILLLDDVQFLTGQPQAQEILLRTLDALNVSGSQIVLASDRPPAEIDGLDARLLSRFSGGLMVDISPPEFETRLAITRRLRSLRGVTLPDEVAEAVARMPYRNVRELVGGLNRILAIQDLEGRLVTVDEVSSLIEVPRERVRRPTRGAGSAGVTTRHEPEFEEPWQTIVREAAEAAELEGFNAIRLRRLLSADMEPADYETSIAEFHDTLEQLRFIQSELDVVGNPWPEAARGVLTDPERLEEARALLASARERVRTFPPFRNDRVLEDVEEKFPPLAMKAAHELCGEDAPEYNPLYVWSPDGFGARELLEAAGTTFLRERPKARAALISAKEFAEEFVNALSEGVAGAWRERWWTVELLMVHDAQELSQTERAQDEFFHLFEAVKRRGARILVAGDRSPRGIENIDDRLRSRFEGGLVVAVEVEGEPPLPTSELLAQRASDKGILTTDFTGLEAGGEVGPDLGLVRRDQEGNVIHDEAELDPAFRSSLDGLEGGSAQHALTPEPGPSWDGPVPLTKIKISPDDFPTLLTEKERFQRQAGVLPEVQETTEAGTTPATPDAQASTQEFSATTEASAAANTPRTANEVPGAPSSMPPAQGSTSTAAPAAPPPLSEQVTVPAVTHDPGSQVSASDTASRAQLDASTAPPAAASASNIQSPELGGKPTEAPQPATAELSDPGPVTPRTASETGASSLPVSELSDIIDAILAPFEAAPQTSEAEQPEANAGRGHAPVWSPSPEKVVWDWPTLSDRVLGDQI